MGNLSVWHVNDTVVAFRSTYMRQSNSRVPSCSFNNRPSRLYQSYRSILTGNCDTFLLSVLNHIQCRPIFHRSSRIHELLSSKKYIKKCYTGFPIDIASSLLRKSVQSDQWSVPDGAHKSVDWRRSNRHRSFENLSMTQCHHILVPLNRTLKVDLWVFLRERLDAEYRNVVVGKEFEIRSHKRKPASSPDRPTPIHRIRVSLTVANTQSSPSPRLIIPFKLSHNVQSTSTYTAHFHP